MVAGSLESEIIVSGGRVTLSRSIEGGGRVMGFGTVWGWCV